MSKSNEKKLFDFYVKQNKVLVYDFFSKRKNDEKVSSIERAKAFFFLCMNFKIENLPQLLQYPQLLEDLCNIFQANQKEMNKIERDIMDGSFFKDTSFKTVEEFLFKLKDQKLLERIKIACEEYEECLICMDSKSDSFTQCGHSMCNGCYKQLNDKNCPFCRDPLGQVYSKEEFHKMLKIKEEKKERNLKRRRRKTKITKKNGYCH